ncbi:MAG: heme-binding protein [Bryobacteraceae bacterium]|jgi:glc operon protein GlcG
MIEQPVIDYAEAMRALETMAAEISRRGKAAVIAVADAHGELIALARMDGARLSSLAIATNKAWTAARSGRATAEVGAKVRDPEKGFDIAYYGDPRFVGWGGGVPIWKDGRIAGSVAVSGLPESEDIEVAAMGAGAIAAP